MAVLHLLLGGTGPLSFSVLTIRELALEVVQMWFLASLWRALCRFQFPLNHSCEQKKIPWMLSLTQVGHWSLAGLLQPGVSHKEDCCSMYLVALKVVQVWLMWWTVWLYWSSWRGSRRTAAQCTC